MEWRSVGYRVGAGLAILGAGLWVGASVAVAEATAAALEISGIIVFASGGATVATVTAARYLSKKRSDRREDQRLLERLEAVQQKQSDLRRQVEEREQELQRDRNEFNEVKQLRDGPAPAAHAKTVLEDRAGHKTSISKAHSRGGAGFFQTAAVASTIVNNRGGNKSTAGKIMTLLEETRAEGQAIDEQILGNEQALGQLLSDQSQFLREQEVLLPAMQQQ